jgi:hypothetical protein
MQHHHTCAQPSCPKCWWSWKTWPSKHHLSPVHVSGHWDILGRMSQVLNFGSRHLVLSVLLGSNSPFFFYLRTAKFLRWGGLQIPQRGQWQGHRTNPKGSCSLVIQALEGHFWPIDPRHVILLALTSWAAQIHFGLGLGTMTGHRGWARSCQLVWKCSCSLVSSYPPSVFIQSTRHRALSLGSTQNKNFSFLHKTVLFLVSY